MHTIVDLNHGSGFAYGRVALGRIATAPHFYLCRMCPYARRCWENDR